MSFIKLTFFALFWIVVVYLINCIIARRIKRIDLVQAALYITTVAMLGVFSEVIVGSLYASLFNMPLWRYKVLPIHGGYTSYYAPVIWGIFGFYLYLLHDTVNTLKSRSLNRLALMFSAEAIAIELLVNISFLLFFNQYIFYYFPSDLWHLTSIQTLPFYFAAGFVVTRTIQQFKKLPLFFVCLSVGLIVVVVFVA